MMAPDERVAHVVGTGDKPVATHPRLKTEPDPSRPVRDELEDRLIATDPILQFFRYSHLPPLLQEISVVSAEAARLTVERVPRNAERTVALRKLLEAKDAAVRAAIFQDPGK
jgi:hypothetical protein